MARGWTGTWVRVAVAVCGHMGAGADGGWRWQFAGAGADGGWRVRFADAGGRKCELRVDFTYEKGTNILVPCLILRSAPHLSIPPLTCR